MKYDKYLVLDKRTVFQPGKVGPKTERDLEANCVRRKEEGSSGIGLTCSQ